MAGDGLAVAALVDEAAGRAGVAAGHLPFTDNLTRLVDSCRQTAALSDTGLLVLRRTALRHLRNLLELRAHVAADPLVATRPLDAPVVVTGLPRTGTTLLHNLLALDPAHRPLRFWEALHPVPSGPGGPTEASLLAQAERWIEAFDRLVPEFRRIHASSAAGPEECDALLQNSFASQHFDDMFDAEAYSGWLATAPLTDEYRHYALQLRALSARPGPGPAWVLKSPSHLGHLDALLDALPGVTVVVCHRHPREAVSSYASLILALRRPYGVDASPARCGAQAVRRASVSAGRSLGVRDAHPGRFVDVAYRDLAVAPLDAVRAVYEHLGRPLAAGVERDMRQWVEENPRHRFGAHHHDLPRFGLTGDEVDDAFAGYLNRFGGMVGD